MAARRVAAALGGRRKEDGNVEARWEGEEARGGAKVAGSVEVAVAGVHGFMGERDGTGHDG